MASELFDSNVPLPPARKDGPEHAPMFQPPYPSATGSQGCLSPLQFFAMTNEPREDLLGLDGADFGLYEERVETVTKRGVELFKRFYWSPELQAYTTGDKKGPQRKLYVLYDRALAARGVLEEVQFIERDEQGRIKERLLLQPTDIPLPSASRDEIMRARNAYVAALLKKRTRSGQEYVSLQRGGLELADRLMEDVNARRRRSTRNRQEPLVPATPIDDDANDAQRSALGKALATSEEGSAASDSSVQASEESSDEGSPLAKALETAAEEPPEDARRSAHEEPSPSLGRALGGIRGFRKPNHPQPDEE